MTEQDEPRIVTPEEAQEWISVSADQVRKIDLAHTVATEPERTRAVVVEALREISRLVEPFSGIGLANGATRADVSRWISERANAIENGAPK